MSNGKPFRIFFSNVSVKLAASDKWIDAQAVVRVCHERTPCTEELRESSSGKPRHIRHTTNARTGQRERLRRRGSAYQFGYQ
jgi:hypothetical protein